MEVAVGGTLFDKDVQRCTIEVFDRICAPKNGASARPGWQKAMLLEKVPNLRQTVGTRKLRGAVGEALEPSRGVKAIRCHIAMKGGKSDGCISDGSIRLQSKSGVEYTWRKHSHRGY